MATGDLRFLETWVITQSILRVPARTDSHGQANMLGNAQGGSRIKKEYLGSNFLVKPSVLDLPTYIIRHISIYRNMTS